MAYGRNRKTAEAALTIHPSQKIQTNKSAHKHKTNKEKWTHTPLSVSVCELKDILNISVDLCCRIR